MIGVESGSLSSPGVAGVRLWMAAGPAIPTGCPKETGWIPNQGVDRERQDYQRGGRRQGKAGEMWELAVAGQIPQRRE